MVHAIRVWVGLVIAMAVGVGLGRVPHFAGLRAQHVGHTVIQVHSLQHLQQLGVRACNLVSGLAVDPTSTAAWCQGL